MFKVTLKGPDDVDLKWGTGNKKYPFDYLQRNPSPALVKLFEKKANEIKDLAAESFQAVHTSSRGKTDKWIKRGAGYFEGNVKVDVIKNPRKYIQAYITSTAHNSLAYEASHGNLKKAVLRAKQGR